MYCEKKRNEENEIIFENSNNEVNSNTFESKIVKNLYICGEALDACGDCGGFNLHFAFASGIITGENL